MDIFRFSNLADPTKLDQGIIINNLKDKMWIERYDKAGEFRFLADANSSAKDDLPIGSLISHVDTQEVMIVENHEIAADLGQESVLTISGRGFETIFENRIIGSNKAFPSDLTPGEYSLGAAYVWNQILVLLIDHIQASSLIDDDNQIPYLSFFSLISENGTAVARTLKRGKDLYSGLLELLEIENIGVKVIRPGPWSPTAGTAQEDDTVIAIHRGVDRSDEIIYSYDAGEIQSADYLWSNKKLKNAAYIAGKWVEAFVSLGPIEFDRRVMYIDGSEFDEHLTDFPDATTRNTIRANMEAKALDVLASQTEINFTKAEVSKDHTKSGYRTDFNVGDIITVSGDYNETTKRRIIEYVEIEDENGFRSYPTLAMV